MGFGKYQIELKELSFYCGFSPVCFYGVEVGSSVFLVSFVSSEMKYDVNCVVNNKFVNDVCNWHV